MGARRVEIYNGSDSFLDELKAVGISNLFQSLSEILIRNVIISFPLTNNPFSTERGDM